MTRCPTTPCRPKRPEKKGLSTGCLVALVALAIILLAFGICIAVVSSSSAGGL